MYLLDTVVLSELRKKQRNKGVSAWINGKRDDEMFISVVSIGEITRGIARQTKINPEFAAALQQWVDRLILVYGDRIIPVDVHIAGRWGYLSQQAGNSGMDILLAATALERGLSIVTRNEKHFVHTGVSVVNPWA
jgi:predicted nucleic acid-binding protein